MLVHGNIGHVRRFVVSHTPLQSTRHEHRLSSRICLSLYLGKIDHVALRTRLVLSYDPTILLQDLPTFI